MIFKKIFSFIIGICLILSYLYFRLVYKRPARSLDFLLEENNQLYFNLRICIFIVILLLVSLYYLFYFFKGQNNPNSKLNNNFVMKGLIYIVDYIKNSLCLINKLIADYVPNSYENLRDFILWFYKRYGYKEKLLIFIFLGLPYIVISFSFLIDTVFFKLNYFYKVMPILMSPLLWSIFVFLIGEILKNLDSFKENMIIKHEFLPDGQDRFTFTFKPNLSKDTQDYLQYGAIPEFIKLYPLKGFLENLHLLESRYKPRFLLFMYSIYFICCSYLIYKNLFIFLYST